MKPEVAEVRARMVLETRMLSVLTKPERFKVALIHQLSIVNRMKQVLLRST